MENSTQISPTVMNAPITLDTSPSFRRSTSKRLGGLYEISHQDNWRETTLPLLNPYSAFGRPSSNPIKKIRTFIQQPASKVLEYIQASKFSQHPIWASHKEQFVSLQLPTEFPGQWIEKGYTHLHFGAIRLALTYHGRKGLPVTARMALLDTRYMEYQHACIGTIETTLNAGTVFVTLYPNFCMSLQDPKIISALQVQVQIAGPPQDTSSIEATLHYQMAYRVQNHALDLKVANDSGDALFIQADYHNSQAPTCLHVLRQISRGDLLKVLPERWITNYEQTHQHVKPIQSSEPKFIREKDGSVTIKFDRSHEKDAPTPSIFPTMFMVQPVPRRKKADFLNSIIHSFDTQGKETFHFKDPETDHCYWDTCTSNVCGCKNDYLNGNYLYSDNEDECPNSRRNRKKRREHEEDRSPRQYCRPFWGYWGSNMAKMSRQLGMRHEKSRGGCMWSLVSKLHSRDSRSNLNLVLDEGHDCRGISRSSSVWTTMNYVNIWDNAERGTSELIAMGGKPSVRTLMEEEMINEANAESRQSNCQRKSSKYGKITEERCKWVKEDSDRSCSRGDEQSFTDDIRDILECLGSLFWRRSRIQGEHDEEKFSQTLGKVLTQQLRTGRKLTEGEKIRRSKVLVNMLRILNSAESSLLDPEVMSTKIMDILHEFQLGRNISEKAARSISSGQEEGDAMSNRIVILKPGMKELRKPGKALTSGVSREIETDHTKVQNMRSDAPSFLSDIKRKLKKIAGKECPDLHAGKVTKQAGIKIEDAHKDEQVHVSLRTKKYLSEVITDEDEDASYLGQTPGNMGMILLYPELNRSSLTSHGRRLARGTVNPPPGSSSWTKSEIICEKWRKSDAVISTGSGPVIMSSFANGGVCGVKKEWREKEQQMSHGVPSAELSLIIERCEDREVVINLPERPSPVSVLEPMFSDNDISPAVVGREFEEGDICISEADDHVRTFKEDEDSVLDRVRALLQASDLKWEDIYLKSQSSGRLIKSPLLHDQHFFKDDAELLVDCVNEALSEACACFIGRSCLSLVKQRIKPLPCMNFTIHEVCREVKWHLSPIPPPRSLEQIVGKDLSKQLSWMDLTIEGEGIGFEVCESILSELLQDIIVTSEDDVAGQLEIQRPS
ncbi:hypothetical protein MLD38_018278 [Melastoma candidum]|uniref:Uncharacterized protein n=1 Tax=Melastoma candidum TaxID=119954 RepID=A0ACB9QSS2_9MYRT|nr:hypothetical protein MLD38_018278 [Melastoma candidum]